MLQTVYILAAINTDRVFPNEKQTMLKNCYGSATALLFD